MLQNNDIIWMITLAISGIAYFSFLGRSKKAKTKIPKISYLIVATVCFIVIMESIVKLAHFETAIPMPKYLLRLLELIFVTTSLMMIFGILASKTTIDSKEEHNETS